MVKIVQKHSFAVTENWEVNYRGSRGKRRQWATTDMQL